MIRYAALNLTLYCFYVSCTHAHDTRCNIWEQTEYIWNFGNLVSISRGLNKKPVQYFETEHQFDACVYQDIKKGDIVWIRGRFVSQFAQEILPHVKYPFLLVISDGDESFPSDCTGVNIEDFIANKNIIHIFAQNCDYQGKSNKVSHLPIGLDYHTVAYKDPHGGWGEIGSPQQQETQLKSILKKLKPTYLRKKRAFVDFQLSDTMHGDHKRHLQFQEDRTSIFNFLLPTGLIDYAKWMKRSDLWKTKGEYAFSISPHGNGLDCHRTWEDLILGCIVIVKKSPLDPLYDGLPVVIVNNWSEITKQNLEIWLEKYQDAFSNPSYRERLTTQYWLNKIFSAKNQL